MTAKPLLIGGLIYLGIRTMQRASAVQRFKYTVADFPTVRMEGATVIVTVPIDITNLSAETFSINHIYARFTVNNGYVGDLLSTQPIKISAFGKSRANLAVSLYLTNAVSALVSLLNQLGGSLTVYIDGAVVTNAVTIPMVISQKLR